MLFRTLSFFVGATLAMGAPTVYLPVDAPNAQKILLEVKQAHPEVQKLGLHAVPPGQRDYAIIANNLPSKIGKKSSDSDLQVINSGKPSVKKDEKGNFFDICLPLAAKSGEKIGATVLEIPYRFGASSEEALHKAEAIRDEISARIPSHAGLFADNNAALIPSETIALPADIKGRFDHFAVDLKHNRLFATPEDSKCVLVYDLVTSVPLGRLQGLEKPHAIYYRPENDRIFVTDGGAGDLKIFDGADYHLLQTIPLEKDADAIGYDASRGLLYLVSGGKDAGKKYSSLTWIDVAKPAHVGEIRIESDTLEAMALDIWRPRLYLNDKANNRVVVIDRFQGKQIAAWPVTKAKDNVAIALDEPHQRLFVGCRSGQVVVFDTGTGHELSAFDITSGVDDLTFDAASKRLYAIGAGNIDAFEQSDADHYRALGRVTLSGPARTGLLVPEINRYFAAVPPANGSPAAIAVLEPIHVPATKLVEAAKAELIHAPYALELERAMLSSHPELRKMGIHAVPPGSTASVIIANANTSRIGVPSSDGDIAAVKEGKTYCVRREDGSFYNLKLPLQDGAGKTIGILVMELPFSSAGSEAEAA